MAGVPSLPRHLLLAVVRQVSQYGEVLPAISTRLAPSIPGVLPSVPTSFLLGFRTQSVMRAAVADLGVSNALAARTGCASGATFWNGPYPHFGDSGGLLLIGAAAGAAAYGLQECDGFLFSKTEPADIEKKTSVPHEGDVGSGSGGGGGDDEDDRFYKLLQLMLELCQAGDSESVRSNFQELKMRLAKEWFELNMKRREVNADRVTVDTNRELNRVKSEQIDVEMAILKEKMLDLDRREKQVMKDSEQNSADRQKLQEDGELLEEKFIDAGIQRMKLEDLIFRAALDEQTVKEMFKDLLAEQARSAADKEGHQDDGDFSKAKTGWEGKPGKAKEEGATGDRVEDRQRGIWASVKSAVNTPFKLFQAYQWSSDSYWFVLYAVGSLSRIQLDKSSVLKLVEKLKAQHKSNQAQVDVTLDDIGMPAKAK